MERCVPERRETLLIQQAQLVAGKRDAQMFPTGTAELPLPAGFARHENEGGVYHFHAGRISGSEIDRLSAIGRQNEFLNLGPFSKEDLITPERIRNGEHLYALVEKTPEGIEIRAAAGTESTLPLQIAYFENTKDQANSLIEVASLVDVLNERLAKETA